MRTGRARSLKCHSRGTGSQSAKSASLKRERYFFFAHFEIEPGAGGLDVGEARGGSGVRLSGGSGLDARGLDEDGLEVPAAIWQSHDVDGRGVGEGDAGELDAMAPQRRDADGGAHLVGAQNWLIAECGILVDDEVVQREAWAEEEG